MLLFIFHQSLPFRSATQLFVHSIFEQELLHESWVAEHLCEEGDDVLLIPLVLQDPILQGNELRFTADVLLLQREDFGSEGSTISLQPLNLAGILGLSETNACSISWLCFHLRLGSAPSLDVSQQMLLA